MTFLRHSLRQKFSLEREARLLHFADPERAERAAEARLKIAEETDARVRMGIDAASALNSAGVLGRKLDPKRAETLLNRGRMSRLMRDTPEGRKYSGVLDKIDLLEEYFASEVDGKIQGIEFGFGEGKFTVRATDEKVIADAIGYVLAQVGELKPPQSDPAVVFPRSKTEIAGDYNRRIAALKEEYEADESSYRAQNNQEINEWDMLLKTLMSYQSVFAESRREADQVRANPYLIDNLPPQWREDNTPIYVELLRDVAIKDPSLLKGKEALFTDEDLAAIIKEAAGVSAPGKGSLEKTNPLALQYLPDSIKKTDEYRGWMVEAATRDGGVLLFAAAEYDAFWKGADAPNTYAKLCVNSVNQSPALFFHQYQWLKPSNAASLIAVETALTSEARIAIVRAMTEANLVAFNRLPGGYASFIEKLITKDSAAALTVVRNTVLFGLIKDHDERLYKQLRKILSASDADARWVRSMFPDVMNDEDLTAEILAQLKTALEKGDYAAVRDGRVDLESVPEHVWRTPANKELFVKIFSTQGDLFAHAPSWMQGKKEYALPIIINNASAYVHASEFVRSDPEVLYAALLAEKKNHKGEMLWKDVPVSLQNRLRDAGFNGVVTDYDNMLRVLILGLDAKKAPLTPKQVHSFMDSWTPKMRKDKELVTAYLERALPGHPEFYLDASPLKGDKDPGLRDDFFFARKMVGVNRNVLGFITTEQHKAFDASHKLEYRAMISSIVRFDPDLFEKIPEEMRNQAEFIMDIIMQSGRPELLQFAPESVRSDIPFLVSVLQGMVNKGAPLATLREFFGILPEDTQTEVLLSENGTLLLKLLELCIGAEALVPPMALQGDLLNRIVLQFKDAENRGRMSAVLLRATPTARWKHLTEHPEDIVYLFENNPSGIARVVDNSLITVDLLATLAEGYKDSDIALLFQEMIAVKPMALVGLLRRRYELWDVIGSSMQERVIAILDVDTLILLRDGTQAREKERMGRDIGKALDDLRVYRQEAHYLMSLDPNLGKVSITWTDRKRYTAEHLFKWLDNERAPAIIDKAKKGEAKPADIYKEVESLRSLVQVLRTCVNPVTANKDALKQPFNSSINADGIGQGEKTGEVPARIAALGALIDVQQGKILSRNASAADKKKAAEFLQSMKDEYTVQLRDLITKLSDISLRGYSADQLRNYLRNVDAIYSAAYDHAKNSTDPFDKKILEKMIVEIAQLRLQARQGLRRATEPPNVRDSEALYDLDAASLQLIDVVAKELKVDRVKFAKALDAQGTRNALILSQEYLPMLKTPQQWDKVIAIAEAFGGSRASLAGDIEAGRLMCLPIV